jgi:hypothetical protein
LSTHGCRSIDEVAACELLDLVAGTNDYRP